MHVTSYSYSSRTSPLLRTVQVDASTISVMKTSEEEELDENQKVSKELDHEQ
jgi:hypothetical protein